MNKPTVKVFQDTKHIQDIFPAQARKLIKSGLAEKLILDGEFCVKLIENKDKEMSDEKIVDAKSQIIEIEENKIILNVKTEKNMDIFIKIRNDENGDRKIVHVDDGVVPSLWCFMDKSYLR